MEANTQSQDALCAQIEQLINKYQKYDTGTSLVCIFGIIGGFLLFTSFVVIGTAIAEDKDKNLTVGILMSVTAIINIMVSFILSKCYHSMSQAELLCKIMRLSEMVENQRMKQSYQTFVKYPSLGRIC